MNPASIEATEPFTVAVDLAESWPTWLAMLLGVLVVVLGLLWVLRRVFWRTSYWAYDRWIGQYDVSLTYQHATGRHGFSRTIELCGRKTASVGGKESFPLSDGQFWSPAVFRLERKLSMGPSVRVGLTFSPYGGDRRLERMDLMAEIDTDNPQPNAIPGLDEFEFLLVANSRA